MSDITPAAYPALQENNTVNLFSDKTEDKCRSSWSAKAWVSPACFEIFFISQASV